MPLPGPPALGTSMLPAGTYGGQVVVVAGGGTGLGLAMGLEFARLGAAIVVASRKYDHREAGCRAIERIGGTAISVEVDVRDANAVTAMFDQIDSLLAPVDVLINNAAGNFPVQATKMSPHAWRSVVDIVLTGTFLCSTEFARRRIRAEQPGAVLNVGATYSWTGGPGTAHSAAAKAGVTNLTQSLAVEWATHGLRVNCLAPGKFPHDDLPDILRAQSDPATDAARIPAGRVGQAPRIRLGSNLSLLTLCRVPNRPHPRPRRRELASPKPDDAGLHSGRAADHLATPRSSPVHVHDNK